MRYVRPSPRTAAIALPDHDRREARWQFFRIVFVLAYAAVVLDVITTAMAYQISGASYEQNPVGSFLIDHLGWAGLFAALTAVCLVCYRSVHVVYLRLSMRWVRAIYVAMVLLTLFRWITVLAAMLYILHPPVMQR